MNEITVLCRTTDGQPIPGCPITLRNCAGCSAGIAFTDRQGRAVLTTAESGCVWLRAASCGFTPKAQSKCLQITPAQTSHVVFLFSRGFDAPETGTLTIKLRDKYYPDYPLKGEFTLWLGLK